MIGLGVDAVDVARFDALLQRQPRMRERLFTDRERSVLATPRLAARFAAKEAVMKALGVGLGGFGWHDVETQRTESGAPELVLRGQAALLAGEKGITRWMVSLTHTDTTAIAVVTAL
ncbi:MAG: holo-[acyl-carrier protein] synthase [Actinomycetota bacterium]|jgi:holo-[acyl-carrier protein] synthase